MCTWLPASQIGTVSVRILGKGMPVLATILSLGSWNTSFPRAALPHLLSRSRQQRALPGSGVHPHRAGPCSSTQLPVCSLGQLKYMQGGRNHEAVSLCQLDILCNGANCEGSDTFFSYSFVNMCGVLGTEPYLFLYAVSV